MTLIFTCKTQDDFDNFKRIVSKSKFHSDSVNYEFRSLYFNCASQQEADKLERDIQFLADIHEISGYFESEG